MAISRVCRARNYQNLYPSCLPKVMVKNKENTWHISKCALWNFCTQLWEYVDIIWSLIICFCKIWKTKPDRRCESLPLHLSGVQLWFSLEGKSVFHLPPSDLTYRTQIASTRHVNQCNCEIFIHIYVQNILQSCHIWFSTPDSSSLYIINKCITRLSSTQPDGIMI